MSDRSRLRLIVMQVLVVSLLLTLVGRLWYLQIYSGALYRDAANSNQIREVVTEATRGQILDDMGRQLVRNRTTLVITVDRSVWASLKSAKRAVVLAALAKQLKMTPASLAEKVTPCYTPGAVSPACWNGSPFQPIPVARDVSPTLALLLLEQSENFPGVAAQLETQREYPLPYGANAAHELGYIGPVTQNELDATANSANPLYRSDLVGRTGLEAQYDSVLRGVNGVQRLSVDRAGNVNGTVGQTPAQSGDNLVTNLDARVQAVLEQQLVAAIARARGQDNPGTTQRLKADSAAGVVMDVTNGHIIAMASIPTYNPSVWVGGISTKEYAALTSPKAGTPLLSRAYQGGFAPGSTFKVVSSTAMLQSGRYSAAGPYPCPSFLPVAGQKFTNSESLAYGPISLTKAIEVSCDTVFYGAALNEWKIDGGPNPIHPKDIFINAALRWGFGKTTGIDLPGEAAGNITTRQSRIDTWITNRAQYCADAKIGYPNVAKTDPARARYLKAIAADNCAPSGSVYLPGDALNFVIGQGETLTTPLKMAQIYAAVANGGTLWTPQVAKAVLSPTGQVLHTFRPVAEGRLPVSKANLAFLQQALSQVPVVGTAVNQFKTFPLAQIPIAAKTGTAEVAGKQPTSWFATYAPANKPRYAVVMMVSQGGYGSTTSADSVRAVYEALFGIHGKTIDPKKSILPGGVPPLQLPVTTPDGRILPPGSVLPATTAATATGASYTWAGPGVVSPMVPLAPATPTSPLAAAVPAQVWFTDGRRGRGGGT